MRDVDELDRERVERQPAAERHDIDRDFRRAGLGQAAGLEQRRRKRRGVERHIEARPQVDERAHMVLVAVGEDEADDVAPLLDQIADVRQDEIDAGQMLFGREGHAAIDDEPFAPPAVADAVDREIHPDLADAAERREHELALSHQSTCPAVGGRMGGGAPASGNTSPAVIACKPPSARRSSNRPCSSSASKRPKNSRPESRTRISPPMPAARAIQSARMAAKPAPCAHCASRSTILPDNAANRSSADDGGAGRGQIGRRISGLFGMVQAVHADTDSDGKFVGNALAFDQNTRKLSAAAENVIRPFQRQGIAQAGSELDDGVMNRESGDERQFRRAFGRRRIAQQERRVEIAGRGDPRVAAPAAARRLPLRGDPQRTALAATRQRQRFRIGRAQGFMARQAIACRSRRGIKLHQNSEWAAALATPTSGPG